MEAWNNDASTVTIRTLLAKQLVLGLSLTALVAHPALSSADVVVDASAAAHNKPTLDVTAKGRPKLSTSISQKAILRPLMTGGN